MNITADERRNVLGLFNIAEAARRLGIPVRKMRWEIASGRLPSPTVALGKAAGTSPLMISNCSNDASKEQATRVLLSRVAHELVKQFESIRLAWTATSEKGT